MEQKIKIELSKFGFIMNENSIHNLNQKNEKFILNQIKEFEIVVIDNKKESYIYIYDKNITKMNNTYIIDDYISKGTYNKAYNVTDNNTNKKYVYRILINKIESVEQLAFNIIEYFIHLFLFNYFKIHIELGKNKILKIKQIGYNKKNNLLSSIMEKMDGTLFFILSDIKIEHSNKINILIKGLLDIINLLEILQKKFQFMHNDLKADNIFFKFKDNSLQDKYTPENINFYLGDFDASTMIIDNELIGNTHLCPNTKLQNKKDMFLLINSLFFSFNTLEWKKTFFNKFPIISEIANNEKVFHSLYSYINNDISDVYLPSNIKDILNNFHSNNKIVIEINYK